ncbi:hypothetical protein B0H15DRAFT_1027198 [Mycena belliarum]|uniref:Uncharacterized protein n=1 Tax=Mycena belliarum TaxID=1033014 RepID=A0AAD6TQT8_9AGAR|nr:hypothetical protein B0H15DRAFT_1027198 [Mycena belliae]
MSVRDKSADAADSGTASSTAIAPLLRFFFAVALETCMKLLAGLRFPSSYRPHLPLTLSTAIGSVGCAEAQTASLDTTDGPARAGGLPRSACPASASASALTAFKIRRVLSSSLSSTAATPPPGTQAHHTGATSPTVVLLSRNHAFRCRPPLTRSMTYTIVLPRAAGTAALYRPGPLCTSTSAPHPSFFLPHTSLRLRAIRRASTQRNSFDVSEWNYAAPRAAPDIPAVRASRTSPGAFRSALDAVLLLDHSSSSSDKTLSDTTRTLRKPATHRSARDVLAFAPRTPTRRPSKVSPAGSTSTFSSTARSTQRLGSGGRICAFIF